MEIVQQCSTICDRPFLYLIGVGDGQIPNQILLSDLRSFNK